jgi:hypothetical protein
MITKQQAIEEIAQALLGRYREQAKYLLEHADAQDCEFTHGRECYSAPVGSK